MQIQSVDNINSNIRFGSKKQFEKASAFVSADDSQLQTIAYLQTIDKDKEKKHQRSMMRLFYILPVVDTIAHGILAGKNVPLSDRAYAAGKTAKSWGFILMAVGLFNAVKKAVGKDSPGVNKFEQDNPVGSFLLDVGAIIGGLALGTFTLNKFAPKQIAQVKEKFKETVLKLDETKLNKEILPKVTEKVLTLAEKAPRVAKASKFVLKNLVWIFIGTTLLKSFFHSYSENKEIEQNYKKLKEAQFKTSKRLVDILNVERDVLAQNQPVLARDLRKVVTGEKPVSNKTISIIRANKEALET